MSVFSNLVLIPPRSKLRYEISKLPQKPTVKQQLKVSRFRSSLGKQVKQFLKRSGSFLPTIEETKLKLLENDSIDTPEEESVEPEELADVVLFDDHSYEEEDEAQAPSILPETVILPLPSNIISVDVRSSVKYLV